MDSGIVKLYCQKEKLFISFWLTINFWQTVKILYLSEAVLKFIQNFMFGDSEQQIPKRCNNSVKPST
jgi:hypothetical protein